MRTDIVIDDRLMKDALRTKNAKAEREAVELGLRTLITWEGDLEAMRTDK